MRMSSHKQDVASRFRFWTMYMTLMFLWWLFFVNSEATLWSVSSMRSSKMIKCFSLGSKLSRSGKPCWNYTHETDQRVASLFTKKSHHRNISVMYIVQNLFHHRTISLNAHYMVLFQNLTDVSQIMDLIYPDPVNLVEILSLLRFHTTSDIHHNTLRSDLAWESSCVWYCERNIGQTKTFDHFWRSHARNGSNGGFTVYEKESPQKHQRHVHRSESVSP
jgi:hypothetical protein